MLSMFMLLPIAMVVFGILFRKEFPKNINYVFGYRTRRSMKNEETWRFAHQYIGKIWIIMGPILLVASVLAMIRVIGQSEETIGYLGSTIVILQIIPLVGTIVPTEWALKRNFDEFGRRRPTD